MAQFKCYRPLVSLPRVVIIGGGFGGLSAAKELARAPVDVLLVDRQNHHVFTPLLYQVATAGLSPGDIAAPIRWILRRQRNLKVWLGEVTAIETATRTVRLVDDELQYDYLIVAAGTRTSYFGHDPWSPVTFGLKTLDDAVALRRQVLMAFERAERERDRQAQRGLLTFVIVGGGPTGVELAGALAEISRHALARDFRAIAPESARIILIEAGPDVLPAYPPSLRAAARRSLERLGVTVWTGTPVADIQKGRVRLGGEIVDAGTILWTAGVAGVSIAQTLGAPLDASGRVKVNPDLTVSTYREVFVAGDLATLPGVNGQPLPGVAQVAMQQGRHAARNIVAAIGGGPLEAFTYRDYGNMATIGRHAAVCDLKTVKLHGPVAWWAWLLLHIYKLIGFRNRLTVLTQWAFSYATYQRSVRLILGGR
jgi:NADH dehydrogenase